MILIRKASARPAKQRHLNLLQGIHNPFDVLGLVLATDQDGIRSFDDDDIFNIQGSDDTSLGVDDAVFNIEGEGVTEEDILVLIGLILAPVSAFIDIYLLFFQLVVL